MYWARTHMQVHMRLTCECECVAFKAVDYVVAAGRQILTCVSASLGLPLLPWLSIRAAEIKDQFTCERGERVAEFAPLISAQSPEKGQIGYRQMFTEALTSVLNIYPLHIHFIDQLGFCLADYHTKYIVEIWFNMFKQLITATGQKNKNI